MISLGGGEDVAGFGCVVICAVSKAGDGDACGDDVRINELQLAEAGIPTQHGASPPQQFIITL